MYIYRSFETDGAFILLRPILITFLIIAFILFFIVILPKTKQKFINGFTVISLSIISMIISAQVVIYHAIIADEIGLGGDRGSMFMFLVIGAFGFLNSFIYLIRQGD
ncbi:hypothetical protein P9578_24075 [Brevibacillus choshinensis]|uniref:hypothetical protein n=1 Tax=Brevibacillus choshinensis TaxID=54911 RepID=UPI002E1D3CBA|nr:hypothetical protein [Brevibacillus choshinensis]MED4783651.1 hypothetical protein [Brevibacillus choshinensis]